MKTTKNKIIQDIKILATTPLYCVVFFSFGCKWLANKKEEMRLIKSPPNLDKLIDEDGVEDEDTENIDEGIINPGSDLLEQPNAEEPAEEPSDIPAEQPNTPEAVLDNNNTTNQKLIPDENGNLQSSNRLGKLNQGVNGQNPIPPEAPNSNTHNGNKTMLSNPKVDNGQLNNLQGKGNPLSLSSTNGQPSNLKASMQQLENRIKPNTPLGQNLSPELQELKNKLVRLKSLADETLSKPTINKTDKKKTGDKETIGVFLQENNSINDILNRLKGKSEQQKQKHVQTILKLVDIYISKLDKLKEK
ncbi:hypothetical protein [Cardinium endosymbiont of Philonthus spinipes]|uniref:hypothetical protein n=1 Tax=Cardinium endosymbiont of Philonthus spinipes TaxID=3077941 RepID=UPI00313C5321